MPGFKKWAHVAIKVKKENKKWILSALRSNKSKILAVFFVVLASGCAAISTKVDREMVIPLGATRYEVKDDQQFIMAVPINIRNPEYPEEVDGINQKLHICASFVVTEEGVVEEVEIVDMPACPDSRLYAASAFGRAVVSAVSGWTFFGAAICSFPEGASKNDNCEDEGATLEPVAIRLTYNFIFDSSSGRKVVSSRTGKN